MWGVFRLCFGVFCWEKFGFVVFCSSWFKCIFFEWFGWVLVFIFDCRRRLMVIIVNWEVIFIIVVFVICCWVRILFLFWKCESWEIRGIRVCSCWILFWSMDRCFVIFCICCFIKEVWFKIFLEKSWFVVLL